MTETKKVRLNKIILVYDDGSTIELSDDDAFQICKNSVLGIAVYGFSLGALEVLARRKKEAKTT
jgi:hypothetical protein